jgi:hypothetical protein
MILYKQIGWIPLMCIELSLLGAIAQTSSTGAQYVTLQNYSWHRDYIFLPTAPIKLKLGLQTDGRRLIWPPTPGSIKLSGQSIAEVSFCCAFYYSTWVAPT